jgi:hypothetical protein
MYRKGKKVWYYYPVIYPREAIIMGKVAPGLSSWKIKFLNNSEMNGKDVGSEAFTIYDNKGKLLYRLYSDLDDIKKIIKELEQEGIQPERMY